MANINTGGVVVGGLAAGVIINVSEYILNESVLGDQFAAAMAAHDMPPIDGSTIALFLAYGFALGLVLVWLYAAMRPRLGPGPKTAVIAGVAAWFLAYVTSMVFIGPTGLFSAQMIVIALIWGLVELVLAALVGARLYSEA